MKNPDVRHPHGDNAECASLVEQHASYIKKVIAKTLRRYQVRVDRDDAEEFFNSFYVHISEDNWRRLRSFKGNSSITTFMSAVAANHVLESLRRRKEYVSLDGYDMGRSLAASTLSPEHRFELSEVENILRFCMENLNSKEILLLKLFFYNELRPREIASILNISAKAVSDRKSRVVEKVKICAEKHGLGRL